MTARLPAAPQTIGQGTIATPKNIPTADDSGAASASHTETDDASAFRNGEHLANNGSVVGLYMMVSTLGSMRMPAAGGSCRLSAVKCTSAVPQGQLALGYVVSRRICLVTLHVRVCRSFGGDPLGVELRGRFVWGAASSV